MSLTHYRGNCHCGAFKFTFTSVELRQAHACTCSFCSKVRACPQPGPNADYTRRLQNGYLWGFPGADFAVVKGDEETTLKTYEFGKRTMVHKVRPPTSLNLRSPESLYSSVPTAERPFWRGSPVLTVRRR